MVAAFVFLRAFQSTMKNETPSAARVFPSFLFLLLRIRTKYIEIVSGEMHTSNLATVDRDIASQDVHRSAKIPSFLGFSFVPSFSAMMMVVCENYRYTSVRGE